MIFLGSLNNDEDEDEDARQRERLKDNWQDSTKHQLCTSKRVYEKWEQNQTWTLSFSILCFIPIFLFPVPCARSDVNTRSIFLFFSELGYSPLKFNSKRNCQHLTNWFNEMEYNKSEEVWNNANSLLRWRFRLVAVVIALAPQNPWLYKIVRSLTIRF